MQIVAHHLQKEAIPKSGDERGLYARSAYNRYYYNTFLIVRALLSEMDVKWSRMPHKDYPIFLKSTIIKDYKAAKVRAKKTNDSVLERKVESGIRAAQALASLMEKANGVRIVADYEPSEKVNFKSADRFSLKSIDITQAHEWNDSVTLWVKDIKQAWDHINV